MKVEGTIVATGKSYIPTVAYAFVNLTQVQVHGDETFTAVANNPEGKAADASGSQKDVSGSGHLHVLPATKEITADSPLLYITS